MSTRTISTLTFGLCGFAAICLAALLGRCIEYAGSGVPITSHWPIFLATFVGPCALTALGAWLAKKSIGSSIVVLIAAFALAYVTALDFAIPIGANQLEPEVEAGFRLFLGCGLHYFIAINALGLSWGTRRDPEQPPRPVILIRQNDEDSRFSTSPCRLDNLTHLPR